MRIVFIFLLFPLLLHAQTPIKLPKKDLIFLDGIQIVFRGSEGTDLLIATEVQRPRLDGNLVSLDENISNLALAQEAKKYRLWPLQEEIEKQYGMIAQNNHKTVKQLDEMVMLAGFMPDEARNEFAQLNAINRLIQYKITENLIVSESDVTAYYNDHPEYEDAAYCLEYAFIPFAQSQTKQQQRIALKGIIDRNDPRHVIDWGQPFWINQKELSEDKSFIAELKKGQISDLTETERGFELFRLVDRKEARLKPLDERYGEILTQLRKPKYLEMLSSLQKGLLDNASIIYFTIPPVYGVGL
jgi:PPIC-type PPIASE domain